jgi:hypothetical protein
MLLKDNDENIPRAAAWKVCPTLHRFLHEWVGIAQNLLRGMLKNKEKLFSDLKKKYKNNSSDKYRR